MVNNDSSKICFGINQELEYKKCEYFYGTGYKANTKSGYLGEGFFSSNKGYGWGTTIKPSILTLKVVVEGQMYDVWIDHFFKETWGRMTINRVNAIKTTMPKLSILVEKISKKGNRYFVLHEDYAKLWLKLAKQFDYTGRNGVKLINEQLLRQFSK